MEEIVPVWYNFIVNEELNTWAVIATYDEEFNLFYLWTPDDNSCVLTPDWKNPDNRDENIWGFFVSASDFFLSFSSSQRGEANWRPCSG